MDELEIFTEALKHTNPGERKSYLDQTCGGNPVLRERVEKLLALHATDASLLNHRPEEILAFLEEQTLAIRKDLNRSEPRFAAGELTPYLSPSPRPGAMGRLGHYDILEMLGQGAFGIVVKAFDNNLQRVVAIKFLSPQMAATSPPRNRFLREARATAQVKHENVVQIYAVEEAPIPYLVMEFVEGETLQDRLDAIGPIAPQEVARIGRQVALGLAAAHEKGLIHRDVKPSNILMEAGLESRARLTDFGLARAGDDASLTQSGVIAGTPLYMSPEQACGGALDPRSDLFSLGSVLYAMVTGRPPFRAPNTVAVLKRVTQDTPRPIEQSVDDVPPGLRAVILRLLEKEPEKRFASAREAANALGTYQTLPGPQPDVSQGTLSRPVRPRRASLAVAVVLVALGVALAAYLTRELWYGNRPGTNPGDSARATTGTESPVAPPEVPLLPPRAIVVTSLADDASPGTLRWAVQEANTRHGEDTIVFQGAEFKQPATITLTQGTLTFTDPDRTTVLGSPAGVTISGDGRYRVFTVGDGKDPANARVVDLTIAAGLADPDIVEHRGGGVMVSRGGSQAELSGCTVRDCNAEDGGGLMNYGMATVINCTFARNTAVAEAGAIKSYREENGPETRLTVINSTFLSNHGALPQGGGGIVVRGSKTEIFNCLFVDHPTRAILLNEPATSTLTGNLTDDESSSEQATFRTGLRVGSLGRHEGPTETVPLLPGSPALNAGDNASVPPEVKTDQRGLPRVKNGKVDIGAVEAQ